MAYTSFTSIIVKSPERGHHVCGLSRGTNMVPRTLMPRPGFRIAKPDEISVTEKETVHLNTFSNTSTSSTKKEQKAEPYDNYKFWIKCLFCPFSAVVLSPSSSGCHWLLV